MDVMILASSGGAEERVVTDPYDIEVGGGNTFEISVPITTWTGDMNFGKRVYIPGTEYGGVIQAIESDTSKETIFVRGYTWRGYLSKKLVNGTYSGDLHDILRNMLGSYSGVFHVRSTASGLSASINLDEYMSIEDAIMTPILAAGYRLSIRYIQTAEAGYVELAVVPSAQYGDEVSQDSFIDFSIEDNRMTVNHLIVTNGTSQVDLYVDTAGVISTMQTQIGIDEITELYEAQNDLEENGRKHLKELIAYKTMKATFGNANDIELNIGDLVSGVDYVTGLKTTKPITSKIVKYEDNELSIEYSIEEDGEA